MNVPKARRVSAKTRCGICEEGFTKDEIEISNLIFSHYTGSYYHAYDCKRPAGYVKEVKVVEIKEADVKKPKTRVKRKA